jgi:hypothetical protein
MFDPDAALKDYYRNRIQDMHREATVSPSKSASKPATRTTSAPSPRQPVPRRRPGPRQRSSPARDGAAANTNIRLLSCEPHHGSIHAASCIIACNPIALI